MHCHTLQKWAELTWQSVPNFLAWNRVSIQHENNSSKAYVVTALFVGLNIFKSQLLSFYLVTFISTAALVG